jgi:hypothetical protein
MPEETKRENYFILLGLDPRQPWSQANFESQLQAKRGEWTKLQNNIRKKAEAKMYLDAVPKIRQVMEDEALRKLEVDDAIKRLIEKEREAKAELQRRIEYINLRGFIPEEEIKSIVAEFKTRFGLDEAVVRAEIAKRKLPDSPPEDDSIKPLDSMTMETISLNLKVWQKKDLYDFLSSQFEPPRSYGRSTGVEVLKQAAIEILDQNRQNAVKDARLTASNELAGIAKAKVFDSAATQASYHLALDNQNLNELDEKIKQITVYIKVINPAQYQKLIEDGTALKIPPKRVSEFIIERASKMGVSVQATGGDIAAKVSCTKCGALNDDDFYCRVCRAPLKIDCPSCGKKVRVEDSACSQCGFPVGNAVLVRDSLEDAKLLIDKGKTESALDILRMAAAAWSTVPPRPLKDPLSLEITRQRDTLEKIVEDRRQKLKQLRSALDDHYYYKARHLLHEIDPGGIDATLAADRTTISNKIAWVERELRKAREMEQKGADTVDQYQAILRECRDSAEALESLSKSPPLPASELTANLSERVVSLTWKASPSKNISYTVVRKPNARPISVSDGVVVAKTSNTLYDDVDPVVGLPTYYAVYTDREGVPSATGATLQQAVMVVAPVTNIRMQVSSKQVHLKWDAPANVAEVRVYRSQTRPRPNTLVGDLIKPLDHTQLVDHNLLNGESYFYTIVSVFVNHDGREVMGGALTVEVRPEEPPPPITEVSTEIKQDERGRELLVSWAAPSKGEVVVLQSSSKPPFQKGEIIPQAVAAREGNVLSTNGHRLSVRPQNNSLIYLTPLVLFQNQAYVGKTIEYANLEDISNLKYTRQANEFQLRWNWVANSHKCIVAYSYDGYPTSPDDENCVRQEITKAQYDNTGFFRIKNPLKRDHYIVVYAVLEENGKRIVASGLGAGAQTRISVESLITLDYVIERKRRLFGKGTITLTLTATGTGTLPAMRLVAKQSAQPIRKSDGEVILQIDPVPLVQPSTVLTYNLDAFARPQRFARLFLENDDLHDTRGGYIHMNHPANAKASVF